MFKITKKFSFEGAHIVRLADSDKCAKNVHGHSYMVEISVEQDSLEENGMVTDFCNFKPIEKWIDDNLDHAMLFWEKEEDHIIKFFQKEFDRVYIMEDNCTAENIAKLIFNQTKVHLYKVVSVVVHETANGRAEYTV